MPQRFALLLVAALFVQSCTYTVTGPTTESLTAVVPADPNLTVTGLDVFQQDLGPASLSCSPVVVTLDYRDEAVRRTQAAWREFREKNPSISAADVRYDSLVLETNCDVSSYGSISFLVTNTTCVTEGTLTASFTGADAAPMTESVDFSARGRSTDCEAASHSVAAAVEKSLNGMLHVLFGVGDAYDPSGKQSW